MFFIYDVMASGFAYIYYIMYENTPLAFFMHHLRAKLKKILCTSNNE